MGRPIICDQYPGETIFVPGNWWHCVVNLDDTIAVTQNYAGRNNFAKVWRATRTDRPCWCHKWLRAMDQQMPELAAEARRLNEADSFDMNKLRRLNKDKLLQKQERQDKKALRRAQNRERLQGVTNP